MRQRNATKFVHVGKYVAEVDVVLLDEDHEWAPYLAIDEVRKLETVRAALLRGDLKAAASLARVYEMKPIAAE